MFDDGLLDQGNNSGKWNDRFGFMMCFMHVISRKSLANFSGTWNDLASGPSGENAVVSTFFVPERLR